MLTRTISRPARWRIGTLALVHVLIAAHIIHWKLAGTSLSSIQLSDAGRFAAEGVATAALFLFGGLLLLTAIFGRVFCAWGCHMLALQEVCRYLLGRLGVRPVLIRLRALRVVPFAAAFYIFFAPLVQRLWRGQPLPAPRLELTGDHLWSNLPGPSMAVAGVLVCALLMVYFLGSLSFCKYACPYGALFAVADRFALGRIRLVGECDGCARCTAACTTGVPVHVAVQRVGMVADSGCMRCLECVSACPGGALAYRFGRPALHTTQVAPPRYALSGIEECGLLTLFGISFVALHGVYDAVPLLVSLAASAIVAFLGIVATRLMRQPVVALRGLVLTYDWRFSRAGRLFVAGVTTAFLMVGHCLLIQYHQWRANVSLEALEFPRLHAAYTAADEQLARQAQDHLRFCSRYGLIDSLGSQMQQAWLSRLLAEPLEVEAHLRRAVVLDPAQPAAHFNLGKELVRQGRRVEAAAAFDQAVRLAPQLARFVPRSRGDAPAQ